MIKIEKPQQQEYNADIFPYVNLVPNEGKLIKYLANNFEKTKSFILTLPPKKLYYRYAANKWTIKEILVHIMDHERIHACRALRIARNDQTPLPGYDADNYVMCAKANERGVKSILKEYNTVRKATISLFDSFNESMFLRSGIAIGHTVTVRALAYHIAGHEVHHINIIKERYL